MRTARKVGVALVVVAMVQATAARAATLTWNLPAGGTWTSTDTDRWLPAQAPVAGDDVIIADVPGQTSGYTVTIGDSVVKTLVYGDLTIGSGLGGNAHSETLWLARSNGLLDVNNATVNTDGRLVMAVWSNLGLGDGATCTLNGYLGGGGQNDSYGSGIYTKTGSRATFVNRGTIDVDDGTGGATYGLRWTNVNFDNIGQTIATSANEILVFNSVGIYGGSIVNGGAVWFVGGSNQIGSAANPLTLTNNVTGAVEMRPGGNDYFDLTTYGATTITNGDGLTVRAGRQMVADGGSITVNTATNPMQIDGMLGLLNGGSLQVTSVDVTVGATGYISNNTGQIDMQTGDLTLNSTQSALFDATGTELIFSGADQQLGLAAQDLGLAADSFVDNFTFDQLTLSGTGSLTLAAAAGDALYVNNLVFDGSMALDVGDLHVYVLDTVTTPLGSYVTGTFGDGAMGGLLLGGTGFLSIIPEPTTVLLLLAGIAVAGRRRGSHHPRCP